MTWKEFWECFPEKIISGFGNGHCVGNPQKIKELLDTEQSQQTFETTVNKVRSVYVACCKQFVGMEFSFH